jgi:hypothetical protein
VTLPLKEGSGTGSNRRPSAFQKPCHGLADACLVKLASPVTCVTARRGLYGSILTPCRRVPGSTVASVLSACCRPPAPALVLAPCWPALVTGRQRARRAATSRRAPWKRNLFPGNRRSTRPITHAATRAAGRSRRHSALQLAPTAHGTQIAAPPQSRPAKVAARTRSG